MEANAIVDSTWPEVVQAVLMEHTPINEYVKQKIEEFFNQTCQRTQIVSGMALKDGLLLESTIYKKLKDLKRKSDSL